MGERVGTFWRWGTLAVGMLVTALALGVGHWFPWVRRLRRIEAYVYGGCSLWLGFAVWRLLNGDWETIIGMLAIGISGWLAVVGAYRLDEVVRRIRQAHNAEVVDDELSVERA